MEFAGAADSMHYAAGWQSGCGAGVTGRCSPLAQTQNRVSAAVPALTGLPVPEAAQERAGRLVLTRACPHAPARGCGAAERSRLRLRCTLFCHPVPLSSTLLKVTSILF